MDTNFCRHYTGDGTPPSNRYCRVCLEAACGRLWRRVLDLAEANGGDPVPLPGTRAVLFPNKNPDFVRLQVNCRWGLPKEDFLHYVDIGPSAEMRNLGEMLGQFVDLRVVKGVVGAVVVLHAAPPECPDDGHRFPEHVEPYGL